MSLITGAKNDEFFAAMECGAKTAADELGVDLSVQSPAEYDASQQIPILNAEIAKGPDAIVIAPTDDTALIPPLRQAKGDGAVVVTADTVVNDPEVAVSEVRSDYKAATKLATERLSELIGGKGKVLLIAADPGITTQDDGKAGYEAGVQAEPGLESLGTEYDSFDVTKTSAIVSATLASDPDLAGIITLNGPSSPGVVNSLERAGKQDDVTYLTFDALPVQVEQLKRGQITELIVQKPYDMGRIGVENAVASLDGESVEKDVRTDVVTATPDTVDDPKVSKYLYKSC
ncbi:MAG: substrate-binding domain-containing protein [Thermoleophilaceae bacterium]|nr:substrate-binding domain-containing protein [Thermoleophilaceae bacterium]